ILCIYAFAIIGFINAGGDTPSSAPLCGLNEFATCESFTCPVDLRKLDGPFGCCCAPIP
ncbi:CLUMA_CG003071, isoform A, partial [Clunio marinus]